MKQCGTARRIAREPDRTIFIWIPVYYSEADDRYHRALPDFLEIFKHYTRNVIKAAENNDPDMDLYDHPSDSTRIRWHLFLHAPGPASQLVSFIKESASYMHSRLWPLRLKTTSGFSSA